MNWASSCKRIMVLVLYMNQDLLGMEYERQHTSMNMASNVLKGIYSK